MIETSKLIDFKKIEGPVYTGRDRGQRLRQALELDYLDAAPLPIEVRIPEGTYSISSSFFLGMFGPSVVHMGSMKAFYEKYRFVTTDFIKSVIDGHVTRALQDRNLFAR